MDIFVTRHGQTDWNAEQRIQGQTDIELNQSGREQAEFVRDSVKNNKYDLIISSPLKRARETADIINQVLNVPIIEDDRLMERNFGKSEGLTKAVIREMEKEHPEITDVWNYKRNVQYNGIEGMQEFCKRVYEFLDEIINKYQGKRIFLVSHGGVFVPMYCYFNKIDLESLVDRNGIKRLENGEIFKFEV